MKFRRFLRFLLPFAFLRMGIVPDEGGGADPVVDTPTPPASTVDTPVVPDAGATPPAADKPATMLEAMFGQTVETPEAKAERLRDEAGRFARKPEEVAALKPAQKPALPGEKPPVDPKAKPDALAMPEGLTPKAQERFQQLANTNKELSARVQEFEPIVNSARELQQTFQQNGIRREQFDQAMTVVGAMNRGDYEGALKALDEQRALLSMAMGRPVPGADALAKFPDLRAEVDNLQMTEARALEIARARTADNGRQQFQQRQQQEQRTQQAQQQDVHNGKLAVDKVCKDLMAADLDYARIEPMLEQQIKSGLLDGIPPSQWGPLVQKTYGLIKQTAGQVRSAAPATSVLRPTGAESPRQAPKSMYEAQWGTPAPSA